MIPVFVNGLGNDLPRQVSGGITGSGTLIHMVFGAPIDFRGSLHAPAGPRAYRRIAEQCIESIAQLGQEEKAIRGR